MRSIRLGGAPRGGGGAWGKVTVTEKHGTIAETAEKDTYRWVTRLGFKASHKAVRLSTRL